MIAVWMIYTLVVGALLGVAAMALERLAAIARWSRRWAWAAAVAASVLVPLVALVTPVRQRAQVVTVASGTVAEPGQARRTPDRSVLQPPASVVEAIARVDQPLRVMWAAVTIALLVAIAGAARRLARRQRGWRRSLIDGVPALVSSNAGPAVLGVVRPKIVVPEWSLELPPDQRALMLRHEMEHVTARDPLLLSGARLAALLMPWNLALWWQLRRLREALEIDCDTRVLRDRTDRHTYGTLLLAVGQRRLRAIPLLAPTLLERPSTLERRIRAMTVSRMRRPALTATLCAGVALAGIIAACEATTPDLLVPDGKNSRRVLVRDAANELAAPNDDSVRTLIAGMVPAVATGTSGPATVVIVGDPQGRVLSWQVLKIEAARTFMLRRGAAEGNERKEEPPRTASQKADGLVAVTFPGDPTGAILERLEEARSRGGRPRSEPEPRSRLRIRQPQMTGEAIMGDRDATMSLVESIPPDQILQVDVNKYAAGRVAPNPVGIVRITLKAGAQFPPPSRDR
jgi:beta-lactamase regulating signal transducer with metallopeptidase domain